MSILAKIILLLVSMLFSFTATSQDSTNFNYSVKLGLTGHYISGTFTQFVSSNNLDATLENKKWSFHNLTTYRFNKTMNAKIENNWFEFLSASYLTKKKQLFPTFFYQFDNNLMFNIEQRHLFGGGASSIIQKKNHFVRLDVGSGYDWTNYGNAVFVNSPIVDKLRRRPVFLLRLQNKHKLFKSKITLSNDLFYRHSFIERSDFFVFFHPKMTFTVLKNLSISLGYEYRLENVHLISLSRENGILLFGFTFKSNNESKVNG